MTEGQRFILLDRDGVINQRMKEGYVTCWEEFTFLPGALEALHLLTRNGYCILVISNQAGIAKGLMTAAQLDEITRRFRAEVEQQGGYIKKVYYCMHRSEDNCSCRKPKSGLLLQAQQEHGFSFPDTFMIGDSNTDLQAAQTVGCPALLVGDGGFPSLLAAAQFIIEQNHAHCTHSS